MRRVIVHMQTTLNSRIAYADGSFWDPFPWGEEETAYVNEAFRRADTWAMGRVLYEAVVPWWDTVARGELPEDVTTVSAPDLDFAQIQKRMTKVVFSRTLPSTSERIVLRDDIGAQLMGIKNQRDGKDIVLSCGPETLAQLAVVPGLIDEYLVVIHPAVITTGPQLFADLSADLALRLLEGKVFDGGAVLLRYAVLGT